MTKSTNPNVTKIPVGYLPKLVTKLKVGDVVHLKGKVIDVYEHDEPQEWESPQTGRTYLLPTTYFYVQSVHTDYVIEYAAPSTDSVRVLQYAKFPTEGTI